MLGAKVGKQDPNPARGGAPPFAKQRVGKQYLHPATDDVILSEVEGPAPKVRGLAQQDESDLRKLRPKGAPSSRRDVGR
jgi:hypothetical protein